MSVQPHLLNRTFILPPPPQQDREKIGLRKFMGQDKDRVIIYYSLSQKEIQLVEEKFIAN